jgi:hypothetical protein
MRGVFLQKKAAFHPNESSTQNSLRITPACRQANELVAPVRANAHYVVLVGHFEQASPIFLRQSSANKPFLLHQLLALDAQSGAGQSLEALGGNFVSATFALAAIAIAMALERVFNTLELATLSLGQLRTDFVPTGTKCRVHHIAWRNVTLLLEHSQFAHQPKA